MSTQLRLAPSHECEIVNCLDDWAALCSLWDEFVLVHPKGSIFHTSQMIRVLAAAKGHSPVALAALEPNGQITAILVAARVQTLPGPMGRMSSRSIMFAEPLCGDSPSSVDALARLIARHDQKMSRRVLFTEVRPLFAPGSEHEALIRCGYSYLEYLNQIVDVSQPLDELWLDVHKTARRKIRQCERRGWQVREVDAATAGEHFYSLLKLSYGRARVPLADRSLFDAAIHELQPRGMIRLFATYEENTPLAMDAVLLFKGRAYLWYGGLRRDMGVSPCAILRWHELRWAHENGFTIYDTGGAGWPHIPYGVRDFKSQFGGQLVQYGRYRRVYSPWKMALAERAYELGRKVLFRK
ncbi:MAG: GNAT family N-acetyltransferase [Pirellulales bacterium]